MQRIRLLEQITSTQDCFQKSGIYALSESNTLCATREASSLIAVILVYKTCISAVPNDLGLHPPLLLNVPRRLHSRHEAYPCCDMDHGAQ